jgi:hypothetical protein
MINYIKKNIPINPSREESCTIFIIILIILIVKALIRTIRLVTVNHERTTDGVTTKEDEKNMM